MLPSLIAELRGELALSKDGGIDRCEAILARIANLNDPTCIALLLGILDDETEYDEVMFSVIHLIEMFENDIYADAIVSNVCDLYRTAPRWAMIIHIRIFNSPEAFDAYRRRIITATAEMQDAVRKVVMKVRQRNSRFASHCDILLRLLN